MCNMEVVNLNFSNMCLNDVGAVVQYVRDNQKQFFVEKRNCHFLGITLKGQSINTFREKKQLLKENYVYFYNQKDDYTCKIIEAPITTYSVHFTTTQEIDTDSFVCCLSNVNKIINLFQKAERAFNSNNVLELYALTYAICSEINREREKKIFSQR